jgi:hypothetical protein
VKRPRAFERRADALVDELLARIDAFRWNEIDFATFNRLQHATWDRIRCDRDPRVLLLVNELLRPGGFHR